MREINKTEPLLVSKRHAAEALSVSLRTIDNLIASRRLPSRKLGARRLIPLAALEELARTGTPSLRLSQPTHSKGDVAD